MSGKDVVQSVVDYARRSHVTQIFVANARSGLLNRLRGQNDVENIVRLAREMEVTVVAHGTRRPSA